MPQESRISKLRLSVAATDSIGSVISWVPWLSSTVRVPDSEAAVAAVSLVWEEVLSEASEQAPSRRAEAATAAIRERRKRAMCL